MRGMRGGDHPRGGEGHANHERVGVGGQIMRTGSDDRRSTKERGDERERETFVGDETGAPAMRG